MISHLLINISFDVITTLDNLGDKQYYILDASKVRGRGIYGLLKKACIPAIVWLLRTIMSIKRECLRIKEASN